MPHVVFKQASTAEELHELQRLNHRTFAEELGQHQIRDDGVLLDRFHEHNRYFIAMEAGRVVGMISLNSDPPFSIEQRLPDGVTVARIASAPCEVRLLAISPKARGSVVLAGLLWQVYAEALRRKRSHILISGATSRRAMYEALGFRALGPEVAQGEASFVPMALDLADETLRRKSARFLEWWQRREDRAGVDVSLLPGPVQISRRVREAFARAPVSHRDEAFLQAFTEVRERLRLLAAGMEVAVLSGSGTLANDAVAACLRSSFGEAPGLVLVNGEFGARLAAQARRAGLRFHVVESRWGEVWDLARVEVEIGQGAQWIWGVHLETSTGQVNDLAALCRAAGSRGVAVAADCVSSLGAIALPAEGLYLATGVSGKSLGAYAGLALVFVSERAMREVRGDDLPATFDVVGAVRQQGPVVTIASPQLIALQAAMEESYRDRESVQARLAHYAELGEWMRRELCRRGLRLVADRSGGASPICTFPLPDGECARRCREAGFRIAHGSEYLRTRGWGQIGVMGDLDREKIAPVFDLIRRL